MTVRRRHGRITHTDELGTLTVITNGRVRDGLTWHDLTEAERSGFDYLTTDEHGEARFDRYHGSVYDLGEAERAPHRLRRLGFDGYIPNGFGFGVCFRYFDADGRTFDDDGHVIGRYFTSTEV